VGGFTVAQGVIEERVKEIERLFSMLWLADLWADEATDNWVICREYRHRDALVLARVLNGDPVATALMLIKRDLLSEYRDDIFRCPVQGSSVARGIQLVSRLYKLIYELKHTEPRDKAGALSDHYVKRLVRELARLKSRARAEAVESLKVPNSVVKLIPDEVLDILGKPRIEITITLSPEAAVELYEKYGSGWREELRRIIRKSIELGASLF